MVGGVIVRAGLFPYSDEPTHPEILLQFLVQPVNATLAMQRDIKEPAGLKYPPHFANPVTLQRRGEMGKNRISINEIEGVTLVRQWTTQGVYFELGERKIGGAPVDQDRVKVRAMQRGTAQGFPVTHDPPAPATEIQDSSERLYVSTRFLQGVAEGVGRCRATLKKPLEIVDADHEMDEISRWDGTAAAKPCPSTLKEHLGVAPKPDSKA